MKAACIKECGVLIPSSDRMLVKGRDNMNKKNLLLSVALSGTMLMSNGITALTAQNAVYSPGVTVEKKEGKLKRKILIQTGMPIIPQPLFMKTKMHVTQKE